MISILPYQVQCRQNNNFQIGLISIYITNCLIFHYVSSNYIEFQTSLKQIQYHYQYSTFCTHFSNIVPYSTFAFPLQYIQYIQYMVATLDISKLIYYKRNIPSENISFIYNYCQFNINKAFNIDYTNVPFYYFQRNLKGGRGV